MCRNGCVILGYMGLRKSLVPGLQNFIFSFGDVICISGEMNTQSFSSFTAPWLSRQQLKSTSGQLQKTWSGKVTKASEVGD